MNDNVSVPELGTLVEGRLRNEIILGTIPPGSRLIEAKLAERFGLSRGPIRDALRELERHGMLASVGRRGKVVCSLNARDAEEVYGVREALETLAIRELPDQVDTLADRLHAVLVAIDDAASRRDWLAVVESDIEFHREIVAAAGNSRLLSAWEGLASQVAMLIGVSMAADRSVVGKGLGGHHEAILAGLAGGRREQAISVLHANFTRSVATLKRCLRRPAPATSRVTVEETDGDAP